MKEATTAASNNWKPQLSQSLRCLQDQGQAHARSWRKTIGQLSQGWRRNWRAKQSCEPLKAQGKGCTRPKDQVSSPVPHHPLAKVITLHIPHSRLDDKYLAQTESGPAASRGVIRKVQTLFTAGRLGQRCTRETALGRGEGPTAGLSPPDESQGWTALVPTGLPVFCKVWGHMTLTSRKKAARGLWSCHELGR